MTLTMNDIETKERIYHGLAYREVSPEVLHQIINSGGYDKDKGFYVPDMWDSSLYRGPSHTA